MHNKTNQNIFSKNYFIFCFKPIFPFQKKIKYDIYHVLEKHPVNNKILVITTRVFVWPILVIYDRVDTCGI